MLPKKAVILKAYSSRSTLPIFDFFKENAGLKFEQYGVSLTYTFKG